jgi:hypothetical protein
MSFVTVMRALVCFLGAMFFLPDLHAGNYFDAVIDIFVFGWFYLRHGEALYSKPANA